MVLIYIPDYRNNKIVLIDKNNLITKTINTHAPHGIEVDNERNILYIKGAVPGVRNSLVKILGDGELKVNIKNVVKENTEQIEKNKDEVKEIKKETEVKESAQNSTKQDDKKVQEKEDEKVKTNL